MEGWLEILREAGIVALYMLIFAVMLLVGKLMKDLTTRYSIPVELVQRDNLAVGIELAGYFLAVSVIFIGALVGESARLSEDLVTVSGYAFLGLIFLNLSRLTVEHIIFRRFSTDKELIEDRNAGVGAVRAGSYLATGLIAAGAIHGEGGGVHTAIVFFLLGQVCLYAFSWIYDMITPFDLHAEIESDNVAAGVAYGGTQVALGLILMKAVSGSFFSWSSNLLVFAELAVISLVLLPIVRLFMDKLVVTGDDLNREIAKDRNVAAGVLEFSIAVGFAGVLVVLL